ncbi:hypothetical protein D4A47_08150 [Anaerotruncus massiliensis (ex Liu et al. 2021)]|uniref:Uncharacterized protein n=2 Tax=Anaerotruncus TaxID=244127 RepID=A0A498D0E3_9FIRM|nr:MULTISPECIES: hypothetical protein [Anaerotruncus]MBC3938901.1 hypothetical protein [Anaerotruncus massiliensis (ex Togo et al. 2019)]RLL10855.1 hypothetical protein D4A47_08150 [Anaerotruncus massiliensis (ex Liu et al. 2021)]
MKKLLGAFLALAMILSMGVTAFAEEKIYSPDEASNRLAELLFSSGEGCVIGLGNPILDAADKLEPGYQNPGDQRNDSVLSGSTVYYPIPGSEWFFFDWDDNKEWKVKASVKDGAKYVKSVKFIEKRLGNMPCLDSSETWMDRGWNEDDRLWMMEVKLKEFPTDDEYKISFKLTGIAKQPIRIGTAELLDGIIPAGTKCVNYTEPFWVTNRSVNADADFAAGHRGEVLKPAKNEDNSITWENNNHTLAWLDFSGDDDGKVFYPKMSTKWDDQEYAEKFADQDAYLYDFLYNPKLASTSRAALKLRIPYLDEDGELAVAPEEIVIYRTIDGELVDITASGKICETEDGEWVFVMKTRELGTYIIAQKPAEAVETEEPAGEETLSAEEDPVSAKPLLPSYMK